VINREAGAFLPQAACCCIEQWTYSYWHIK